MTPSYLTLLDRSSEHLAVSVTLAWLNNGGNEDGDSTFRSLGRDTAPSVRRLPFSLCFSADLFEKIQLLQFCLFRQIHVPNPIQSCSSLPIQSRSSPQTVSTLLQGTTSNFQIQPSPFPGRIVHGDVKTKNIHFDYQSNLKITDFGVARVDAQNPEDMVGESVLDGKPYNISCDVYSFTLCFFEISVPIPYPHLSLVDVSSTVVRQGVQLGCHVINSCKENATPVPAARRPIIRNPKSNDVRLFPSFYDGSVTSALLPNL
ncbi:hypothetical protein DY000_02013090 [Brassica cretica]|uniref:Protein kinase domain-containing protein n=1 Tax=Brassica cretica TaxID=69181 RepID=A0ABQ7D2N2_BRACR|nr:hypothetical protein DY000_02013090 [Brassica cretica]